MATHSPDPARGHSCPQEREDLAGPEILGSATAVAGTAAGGNARAPEAVAPPKMVFGVNEIRLDARQWLAAFLLVGLVLLLTPWMWQRVERFETGPDYRIPYALSKDYWLYGRWLRQGVGSGKVVVLGDSVVWGRMHAPRRGLCRIF